jgi:hypothetical protein
MTGTFNAVNRPERCAAEPGALGCAGSCRIGPRDEDITFLAEGLRQLSDRHRRMAELLGALVALADMPGLPDPLRPIIDRARELAEVRPWP